MFTVGELKKVLDKLHDDVPVMVSSRYQGYDPVIRAHDARVCFQGYHAESGGWEMAAKAKQEHKDNGSILALLIESD